MELQIGPEIISSYKRLAYQVWYALAEFVDNSTQAYFDNKKLLDRAYANNDETLTVHIEHGKDIKGEFIRITDNSIGMSKSELECAVVIGRPPKNTSGRSKYGLGLKTGACWFGDLWTVETKKLCDALKHKITVDVTRMARGYLNLHHKEINVDSNEHFTIVEIRKLHRQIAGRTLGKVKDYLRSLYRIDISKGVLILKWNNEILSWNYSDIDKRLLVGRNGRKIKRSFRFKVGRKNVFGWAGVLEKGSRRDAGFSIIQSDRVITGWPDSYRPETLYGSQEGGSNDLVNQRLVGELFLRGFDVSHTKDQILFDDGEQERLELNLKKKLGDLRKTALTYRKGADDRLKSTLGAQRAIALNSLEREINSNEIRDFLRTYEIPKASLIKKVNESLKSSIKRRFEPTLSAKINDLAVSLFLVDDMSPNDPYVIIESTESITSVVVIINLAHPHWSQITQAESILNFIRHCVYDGVSEWKAYFKTGRIEPDTVKLIKDNLLRIPMSIQSTSSKSDKKPIVASTTQ